MAGRHARRAPLILTRALAALVATALLPAAGVVAVTVLIEDGSAPTTARDRAAGATSGSATTSPIEISPGTTSPDPTPTPSGNGAGAVTGAGTATAEQTRTSFPDGRFPGLVFPRFGFPRPVLPSPLLPGPVVPTPALPSPVVPGAVAQGVGWWTRSDPGRAHGRALGLLTTPGRGAPPARDGGAKSAP